MYWLQAFILLLGIHLNDAGYGYGNANTDNYVTPDSQSDVEAPAYLPPYLKHQFSNTGGYTNNGFGTKNVYSGTKNVYSGTKNVYSGTKNVYSGTKNVYSGTKNPGYGGGGGYSEARQWYSSSSGGLPNYAEFVNNANQQYQQKCDPECKNSGICIDTNTCECPPNFHGKYCEFEKKPCLNYPPLPMNSRRKCTQELCTITCMDGYKFIDGSTVANMRCMEGQWTPSRTDLTSISDCQPECDPPCLNGGVCLALNTCNCPAVYRGPQCQYSESACDVRKLAFNGGYKCFGDESRQTCKLSCPVGAQFSADLAAEYSCLFSTGQFEPQPIPHCVFTDVVVITPSNHQNDTFYSFSESSGRHNESFSQSQYGGSYSFGGGSHSYGGGSHSYGGGSLSYGGGSNSYGGGSQSYGGVSPSYVSGSHSYGGGSYDGPVQVVFQDMTPKGGTCLTWAGVHYKTFDGMVYTFQSPCQHILLRDPKEHKYSVEIKQSTCKRQGYCPSEITLYLEDKSYVLAVSDDGSVLFRSSRRLIPIPASLPGLRVSMPSDYVLVNLDAAGVAIQWDTNNLVQIEGSVLLWNNTEGLCGLLDGNPANDLRTKDGQVVQSKTVLASSWKVNKIGDICEGSPTETAACASETAADVTKAAKFCSDLVALKKFHKCSKVMDVLQFLEACKWDYCACSKTFNSEECACSAVSVYAKECLKHGVQEMKNWRDADTCPMKCPEGKLYKACGADVQPSCVFPLAPNKPDTCVEGCYCPDGLLLEGGKCVQKKECPCRTRNKSFPPGSVLKKDCNTCSCESGEWLCTKIPCGARCRAVGDPHYTTFDGLRYDFMGHCTYTMMQADNVTVHVENVACSGAITEAMNLTPYKGDGKPSCTKAVMVEYGGAHIHLKQGGSILVNGKEVTTLPVMVGDVRIRAASSLFLIVQLPNKVDLWWDGNTRVFIDVPASFHGKTKGLCGTFNLNQKDDFLTPENDIEQSTLAFANKWKTREFCSDEAVVEPEHPCKANVESKEAAEKYCGQLKGKIFDACHWHVDVEPYYESCVYDMCACAGDTARCLCPALGDYAMSCAKAGVMLQWRYNVQECELTCTGGQEYTVCADSCLRKCSDSALASSSCSPVCVEGCACPQGQLLDESGMCVPVALCPCFHKGLEFKAGYKEVRAGRRERELCTCVGARWDCVPATPDQIQNYPPAEDLRTNCSAAANMEFTTCAQTEPLTCKNMHLPPAPLAAECRPGCKCASGYVLDKTSNRCLRSSQCPCHHGGVSYPDGHAMQEECNQCVCKSGNWSCTARKCAGLCSAWGDSHVTSFDGTEYDFEGVCTYLLAKGAMDGRDGFDVEIQNVPCGTTGATCSKSVTLKVGSGNDEEIVSLTKHAPLPDISKLKRIKLRLAGAYVFLDVPSLGMSLQWDREMRVYVKVDSMWHGRVKGLCGNYNGDMRDDFQTPSGGGLAEASPLIFADSWKLKPTCPKPQRIIDHCKQRPERKDWAAQTCGALKRYPFTLCHTEVPPGAYVERCERDACACDAGGDCQCACAALAHYAHACAHRGVTFKWRSQEMCPMQCDEKCSNYDACVSACPIETCDNTLYYSEIKTNCEQDTCVEGCKPKKSCPDGQVYKNSSVSVCVPVAACKPVCLTLEDGTEVAEGEVLSEDACHTCRCSKHQRICTGQPCATETVQPRALEELTSPKPHDEPLQCVGGWTPWISRGAPETASNGDTVETEPLPQHNELHIGSSMCKPEQMTDIECRTVEGHKTPKETGLDAECSLERGLVCREKTAQCPDFEIRTYCQCSPDPCVNTTKPSVEHPTDCSKFIECSPQGPVEKQCVAGTLYNPDIFVCDWPFTVAALRPLCGINESTPSTPTTPTTPTTLSTPTTRTTPTIPTTPKIPTTPTTPKIPSQCPPGQVFLKCAYPCDKLCDHFKKTLMSKGRCNQEKCVEGCVDIAVANIKCDYGSYWRDTHTCVPKRDCTCLSDINNTLVKPGGVVVDGCISCQCRDNELHCDNSECVSVHIPHSGSTHEPYILPQITETPATTVTPSTTSSTTSSTTPTWTPSTPSSTVIPSTTSTSTTVVPKVPVTPAPIIVPSTVSPPPECAPDNYMDLMWGDEPLPSTAFSASSVVSELFEPQFARLHGHPLDVTAGSWNPKHNDLKQYMQVELPRREPIYGLYLQGSPLFDQFVTSYELLYGDDGVVFHTVQEAGKTKVFRGPTDHNQAMKQMIVPPIEAKYIRVHPLTWHEEISVRMELIGCGSYVSTTPTEDISTTGTEEDTETTSSIQCSDPLGAGADLPLSSVSVSSNEPAKQYLTLEGARGWRPLYTNTGEWVMFNFTSPRIITGIKTMGGEQGWVAVYKVMFSSDLENFSPVLDKKGQEKLFPGNFDKTSEALSEFRPPINAQYLKVLPVKWHSVIEMRVEPIGCFEPYPTPAPTIVTAGTSTSTPAPCALCPGVPAPDTCACAPGLLYDGEECVPRAQCPCLLSFMSYPVGSTFRGANCDECVCKLGGVTACTPAVECRCDNPQSENVVPKLLASTCECVCEPCAPGSKACQHSSVCLPLSKWCDGVQDCADDELNCTTPAPTTEPTVFTTQAVTAAATRPPTTTVAPLECPVVACPVGYKVQYKVARPSIYSGGDLPPPRPRNSYRRYYGGGYGGYTKTGYSAGGFSKGGFSKGGFSKGGFSKGGFGGLPAKPSQSFILEKPTLESTPTPTKEVCPQWACVPPVPPFHPPGVTPKPQVCSVVTCPKGYSLLLDTVKGGASKCPQYECVPPPERPAYCNVTGRTFNTFDNSEYKYDVCFHILARENRVNAWTVVVRKKCRAEGCWNELLISQEDQLILVKPSMMIEYDNYEYTVEQTSKICFQKNSFDIARLGDGVSIKSRKYNFTVLFNKEGDIKIGVLKKHMGTVDGLCGAYDGDASNDRSLPDGNLATSIDQFGRAWGKPGMATDACQARVVAAEKQKRVWDLCSVIATEPLSRCGNVLNLDKWRSICLEKICECTDLVVNGTKRSEQQCRCLLLQQLVSECLAGDAGVDLAAWRLRMECPAECPAPLVHYDCFRRRCEPSCGVTNALSPAPAASCGVEPGTCHPGCYCPEGTLRRGSDCVLPDDCRDCKCDGAGSPAEYVTFEGDHLPAFCNCTYLASRDRNITGQHKYQVFATNALCEDNPSTMCTKSVHLAFGKKVVHVSRNPDTKKLLTAIDDVAVYKMPLKQDWGSITSDNGHDVTITLADAHLELTVLASNLEFKVSVPSSMYGNATEGLCGVCAGYQEALLTSNGSLTDDFVEYGKSWQATPSELDTLGIPPQEQCDQPPVVEECVPPPPATSPCYTLYNKERFGACHALVDPAPFVSACEAELCANVTDVCGTLARYAAECRAQAVCLDSWRIDLCPYPCSEPLVYRACVDCERSCENHAELAASPGKCDQPPREGCFCPEGKVRVNNTCIEPAKCFPCDANKEHFAGDQWQTSACTRCTCSKVAGSHAAHVSCTTESCTTPVCASAEELVAQPPRAARCCPVYTCVPKPKTADCVEPKKMECGFGQILKQKTTSDGCTEFACECKPASECESIPSDDEVEMFEPGMERVVDRSGCCPRAELLCRVETCPRAPPCPKHHDLITNNDTDKCCPQYSCELPKDKCLVNLKWEAASRGGEKARTTPQVLLKDLDSVWLDGPCRSCRCEPSSSGASPECSVSECAPILSTEQFVVEPRPVPFACCPLPEQVACRDRESIYKVGENWTSAEDVCTKYRCVRNDDGQLERVTTVQACDDTCQPGWKYLAPTTGQCCGECTPAACVVAGEERPIGAQWRSTDHCANYTCTNNNGTLQIVSANETCTEVPESERKLFVLKEEKVAGQCCPLVEAVACRVGNDIYQEGQTWQTSDPCKKMRCVREGGRLGAQAQVESCVEQCARGRVYRPPPQGVCCGACVEDSCVVGNDLKKPGTTWHSADNCTTYSCARAGDEVFVTSSHPVCPDVSTCEPERVRNDTCCQVCDIPSADLSKCVPQSIPRKDTVGLIRKQMRPHGLCKNLRPLRGFQECRGSCDSGALFDTLTGVHNTACECCTATKFVPMEVSLACEDGSTQQHRVASPARCACRPCGQGDSYWPTKNGVKNPHPLRMIMSTTPAVPAATTEKEDENEFIPNIYQRFGEKL